MSAIPEPGRDNREVQRREREDLFCRHPKEEVQSSKDEPRTCSENENASHQISEPCQSCVTDHRKAHLPLDLVTVPRVASTAEASKRTSRTADSRPARNRQSSRAP